MVRFGVTGGIGSGKSYVLRLLAARGIPVYDSDAGAKRLMRTDTDIRKGLTDLLGEEVYTADGELNKPLVSASRPQNGINRPARLLPVSIPAHAPSIQTLRSPSEA